MSNATRYAWTMTGMAPSDNEGPMRYVREVDYDRLKAALDAALKDQPKSDADILTAYFEPRKP